jgi:DNA invertase Pin-like site-specific DNA recombinase
MPQQHVISAAVMARVSTAEQAAEDKESLPDQIEKGKQLIAERGWNLYRPPNADESPYPDAFTDVYSGTSSDRPELAKIIAAASQGAIQMVVFTRVDRMARDLRDLLNIEAHLASLGAGIVATDQPIDTSTPAGRLMFQQLGSFAEFERTMFLERTTNIRRRKAAKGEWPGGTPPYGFRLVNGKVEHDPDEVKVIHRAVAHLLDEGLTLRECAEKLNAEGFRPRKALRWDSVRVRLTLSNKALAGTLAWAKPKGTPEPNGAVRRSRRTTGKYGGPIEIAVPAILDEETFDRVQAVLAEAPMRRGGRRVPTASGPQAEDQVYMVSGRLTAPCGRRYRGQWRAERNRRIYRCPGRDSGECDCRRINADEIEELVWDEVVRVLSEPERVAELARRASQRLDSARVDAQALDRRIDKLQSALERAYTAGLTNGLDPTALQAATANIAADLAALRRERDTLKVAQTDAAEVRRRLVGLRELADRAASMSPLDRARLVRLMDVRVQVVGFGEPTADWPHPFTFDVEGVVPLLAADGQWGRSARASS